MRSYRCGVEQSVSAGALSLLRGSSYRGSPRDRATRASPAVFLCVRVRACVSLEGNCAALGYLSLVWISSSRGRDGRVSRTEVRRASRISGEEEAGAAGHDNRRDDDRPRRSSPGARTFTTTQGNQLRNKLSFYRILRIAPRALPRRGAGSKGERAFPPRIAKGRKDPARSGRRSRSPDAVYRRVTERALDRDDRRTTSSSGG